MVEQQPVQTYNDQICCRICLDLQPQYSLVSPCLCKGSTRYVHQSCLMQWAQKNKKIKNSSQQQTYQIQCQICKQPIPLLIHEQKRLRTCSQIKSQILQQKIIFTLQVASFIACIVLLSQLGNKFVQAFHLPANQSLTMKTKKYLYIFFFVFLLVFAIFVIFRFVFDYVVEYSATFTIYRKNMLQCQTEPQNSGDNLHHPQNQHTSICVNPK